MSKRNRFVAIIIAVAMAIGLVSSAIYVIDSSEHKCSGIDCQLCERVQTNLKHFNNQTPKPEKAVLLLSTAWVLVLVLGCKENIVRLSTLVELKTKLSN